MEMSSQYDRIVALESLSLAREYALSECWGRAVAHYLIVIELRPDGAEPLQEEFAVALGRWAGRLLEQNLLDKFFQCCKEALTAYPEGARVLFELGRHLMNVGYTRQAAGFLQKAVNAEPDFVAADDYLNRAKNSLVSRWHYRMLNDQKRNLGYRRAIRSLLRPGDLVADVGCGTGLLSMYAVETGAEVVACESNETMFDIATKVLENNGVDGVRTFNASSKSLEASDRAFTAVVTEIFDAGLFGEGVLETLSDAWSRLLEPYPRGRVLPRGAVLYLCGVESPTLARKFRVVKCDDNPLFGHVNFGNVGAFDGNGEPYDSEDLTLVRDLKYVTEANEILRIDFQDANVVKFMAEGVVSATTVFKVLQDCKVDAYAMWFDLILTEDIVLTSDPRSVDRCAAWDCAIFHRKSPISYVANDSITLNTEWERGLLRLIDDVSENFTNIPVSKDIIRTLNDAECISKMIGAVIASCVQLVQLYPFNSIRVLDYSPFPIVGLLMVLKGACRLCCSIHVRPILEKLAECNSFNLANVSYFDSSSEMCVNDAFEVIVDNLVDTSGMLCTELFSHTAKADMLSTNGIIMPNRLTMVAKLVSSQYLNTFNRVYDSNLTEKDNPKNSHFLQTLCNNYYNSLNTSNCDSAISHTQNLSEDETNSPKDKSVWSETSSYKVADVINGYQVTLNNHHSSEEFKKLYLSDEVVIYEQCVDDRIPKTVTVIATCDGKIDAVQTYFRIRLMPNGEEILTDRVNSYVSCAYHLIDPPINVKKGDRVSILVFCANTGYMKMIVDVED